MAWVPALQPKDSGGEISVNMWSKSRRGLMGRAGASLGQDTGQSGRGRERPLPRALHLHPMARALTQLGCGVF